VHQQLLDLGFLEYVNSLRAKGTAKLFPDFRYDPKNGWGRQLGRWFNERLLPALDLKSKELVFHSLRHTVVTRLMQKDVAEAVVKALVGHQQDGVTQNHYFKQGYTTDQLNNAMQKLDYDLPR
jgi:integrase